MSAKKARREGSSESNRTGFHEWGAASRENFAVGFIRVYLLILGSNVQRLGRAADRGGPQRSRRRKENPGRHRQPLQELIRKKDLPDAVKKPIGKL